MSKIDEIKEKISLLKFWLGVCVALIISIGSWLFNNYNKISFLFVLACLSIGVLCYGIYILSSKIMKYIKELREL